MPTKGDHSFDGFQITLSIYIKKKLKLKQTHVLCTDLKKKKKIKKNTHTVIAKKKKKNCTPTF